MCIKFPFPIISTLSQYPEFKLNIHHLYTFDLEKYQSLIVQPPHTPQPPPIRQRQRPFSPLFLWIYSFPFLFSSRHYVPRIRHYFFSRRNLHSRPHPVISALIRVFYLQMTVTEKRAVVAFRKSRLFKPYRSAFRGLRGDGGGGGCVFLR